MKIIRLVPVAFAAVTLLSGAAQIKEDKPPDTNLEATQNRCWKVRTKCCAECSKVLPTNNYGCDFQKCMRECMNRNGCNYLP